MKKHSPLWDSISILIGIVIGVLALVRGKWLLPLLLVVFGLWTLWLIVMQLLPAWRQNKAYRQKETELLRRQPVDAEQALVLEEDAARVLLHHVNYRISSLLKSAYPKAHWEWLAKNPVGLAVNGGTGRIRVFGVPDYQYAEVTLDQNANIKCDLVQLQPVTPDGENPSDPSCGQSILDPQVWYELRGRKPLETLITDLHSRGHSSLTVKENGDVIIRNEDDGKDEIQDTLLDFPRKVYWPQLVDVLTQEGIASEALADGIQISW